MNGSVHPVEREFYEFIHGEEDARACRGIPDEACRVVPGNYLRMVLALVLLKTGDVIVNPKSVLPWLIGFMGVPASYAGVLVPLRESGSMLPQLAIAAWIREAPVRKGFFVLGALLQGAATLGLAVAALTLEGHTGGIAIVACVAVFSLARGLCSIAQKDVLGKTVPKAQRGTATGVASSAAGAVAIAVAAVLWFTEESATRYFLLLVAGFGCWLGTAGAFALIDEYEGATEGGRNGLQDALARLALVREDPVFRHFLAARTLLMSTALLAPYVVLLGQDLQDANLAFFVLAQGAASLLGGPFWGRFADAAAHRTMAWAGFAAAGLGVALVLVPPLLDTWARVAFFPLAFFVLMGIHDGVRMGRKTYVVDIAGEDQRTDYVSVSNTIIGALLLASSALGLIADAASVETLVLVLAACAAAGGALAWTLKPAT
jgi:hypothetical protein